jgi:hypothetical protein
MALVNPASAMVTALHGTLGLTSGTNLFAGPRKGLDVSPAQAVFVQNQGGPQPEPYMGTSGESFWQPEVWVHVRGNPEALETTETLARAIQDALHLADLGGGAIWCYAQNSQPTYAGEDDSGCPSFICTFQVAYKG